MSIAQGVSKQTRVSKQSAKGTIAAAGGGQILRREQSTFELAKETYTTESEITSTQQVKSSRHGVKTVNGSVNGILSPGTYSGLIGSVLRRDFAAVTAISSLSITISGSGPSYTVARSAGSWLTDGIKVGMVVRLTAGSFSPGNLNNNMLVLAVTALNLTVMTLNGSSLTAQGPIASATLSVPGKVSYVPDSGHTKDYYTVEEWYPDAAVSERNTDVRFVSADFSLPGSGNAKISLSAIGLDQSNATSAYFTSPTAETSTDALVAANGLLLVNGSSVAVVTDLRISVNGNGNPADGVVGSNVRPDVFVGKVSVTGQFTAYFEGGTIPGLYLDETETSIISALAAGSENNADFMTLAMSAVKLNSSSPDDNETGLKRTYSFVATYDSTGGVGADTHATSLMIHDSRAA
jgi:hypothetical protein